MGDKKEITNESIIVEIEKKSDDFNITQHDKEPDDRKPHEDEKDDWKQYNDKEYDIKPHNGEILIILSFLKI